MTRSLLVSLAIILASPCVTWAQKPKPAKPGKLAPATPTPAPQAKPPAPKPIWKFPLDAAVGHEGTYYIADRKLPGIWTLKDDQLSVFYKGTEKPRAPFNSVRCLHVAADGAIFAGDSATSEIYSVSASGEIQALSHGSIGTPNAICVVDGTVYVADVKLQRIWKFPVAGLPITQQPTEFAVVPGCRGLFIDDLGFIWVLSTLRPQLRKYTGDGKFEPVFDNLVFEFPQQVCVTADGTAFVTDSAAKAIWKITRGGQPDKWVSGDPLVYPTGIRQQGADLIVCDSRANALFKVTRDAKIETILSGPPNSQPADPTAEAAATATPETPTTP